jgi:choline dehydrogenase-like flavoprotein
MVAGKTTFDITSQPSPELKGRTFPVIVGCLVGGSSAINGRVFQKGTAEEYNTWGALAGSAKTTWTWENIFQYFKKVKLLASSQSETWSFLKTYFIGHLLHTTE